MHDLQVIQFDNDIKFVSFDISNMYTNIPTNEITDIIQHKEKEYRTIQQILHKNKFQTHHLDNIVPKMNAKSRTQQTDEMHDTRKPIKWTTFKYTGKQTKYITKLFKNTNIKITYKTNSTLERLLTQQHNKCHYTNQNKFQKKSVVHQLVCKDCNKKYTGQTGRSFYTRFKEHFRDYKYNNGKSNFAQHLIDNNHTVRTMEYIMNILYITKKGKLMDTLERFHIYD